MAPTPLSAPNTTPAVPARRPDLRALQVAQWVQARVPAGDVYLFGSRARGDWEAESDIDLMVLAPEPLSYDATRALRYDAALDALVARLFGAPVSVQVMSLARAEFDWARTSPYHLAGGVQRDGLDPGGQPMTPVKQDNPWPAVQQHLRAAHASLRIALQNAAVGEDSVVIAEAQNALENCMKAYAVACGAGYKRNHKLAALAERIQTRDQAVPLPSADWLRELSNFREKTHYDADLPLPGNARGILAEVQALCSQVADRALALCDKTPRQVRYKRHKDAPWSLLQPLAGMEKATPDDFRPPEDAAQRARELSWVASLYHSAADVAAFERYLARTPRADWPNIMDLEEGPLPRLLDTDGGEGLDPDPDTKGNGGLG